jgi:hypothetical protein
MKTSVGFFQAVPFPVGCAALLGRKVEEGESPGAEGQK